MSAAPVVEGQVLVTSKGKPVARWREDSEEYFKHKPLLSSSVIDGSMDDFSGNVVAIGVKLAERFELSVGDNMTLMSPNGKVSAVRDYP